ncbi:dihydroorotate oxidase A [Thalassoporum mexicanum PCC 7367]|uniref:quinone-dependent dihydroorotate dehydrogenase n=1 Tax=Thalassoporum mexicanum TaxID=3457544 RepID=UPI00029FF0B8|nr:quinone-dependent dihydroorotate dehydrogenase [Pseudanabaena sp. PCC 7367]AFY68550.1 dihydroorotate oxidase A [Pseudanabaena sp. PCC 7367]
MLNQIYKHGLRNLLFTIEPEQAHRLVMNLARQVDQNAPMRSLVTNLCTYGDRRLGQKLWGLDFSNPVGLAAGFDKNAEAAAAWASFGFGFAELGTITALAQAGNPQPRLFRLPNDQALLNRMGFNNLGSEAVAHQLEQYLAAHPPTMPIGINLGKSKVTALENASDDYLTSFRRFQALGDYFVVNVSSPNTPGLRDLQAIDSLAKIITTLQQANQANKPILVKIAPDLSDADIRQVVQLSMSEQIAGIIATNTTIRRDNLSTRKLGATGKSITDETGGISGMPLRSRSTEVIKLIWQETHGQLPIIGVGGIFTGTDAWEKITAGATMVQLYTGWVYGGPGVIRSILQDLVQRLETAGLSNISEAVGLAHK